MPVPIPVPLRGNSNTRLEAKYNVITEFPSFDLHSAAATGNMGLVEYALQRGQPINSVLDGVLPLHAACAGGNEQVVKLLIDHGADVNAPRLPRRYSNEKNRDASAPIVGTSGSTPLHFAAANGNTSIITMLLLKGAHADRADKHGITPEQLAMQNGWLQSAELLRNWAVNKDRDLRERKPPISDDVVEPGRSRHGSFGFEGESSRRLRMKQSVDHALNMLKSPSSGLSEAYSKPTSSTNTPPTSPTSRAGKQSLDTDRPSSNGRRPSLGSPHATSTKGFSSPRRPRSAGTGAEERNSPKGSTKKLTTKYSLLSLFKKSDTSSNTLERTESYPSSVASLAPSPSISSPRSQPIPISTSPRNPDGFGTSMTGSPSGLRHQMESANSSPGHSLSPGLHRPSAVDLHNVLARQQEARRDRSGSSSSRIESIGLGLTIDSTESPSSSPPARRPRAPSQLGHSRHRSGSANRNGTVFDDEVIVTADKSVRPSILRAHNRSSSSGQGSTNGVPNLRALRFHSASNEGTKAYGPDGHSLRPCNSTNSLVRFVDMPEEGRSPSPLVKDSKFVGSAPPTVLDFNATTSLSEDSSDDDDEDYGRALERRTRRASANRHRGQSFSSIISDVSVKHPDFPFSIREAPPSGDGASIRQEGRGRGDSLSSTTSTNPNLSVSGMTSNSGGSVAATPPQSSPRPSSLDITSASPGPKIHVNDHDEAELDVDEGEPEDVNQMPIQDPNPHAQAEARVQRAQQDILAHVDEQKNSSSLPLSARLAAYGESLAKLRELQAEAEAAQTDLQNNIDTMNGTGSRAFNRQRSMDALSASASNKVKRPRRPHTSSGASSSESILSTASGPSHQTFRPNHTTARSISDFVDPPTARLPAGSLYNKGTPLGMAHCLSNEQLSRVNSSEGIETDTELGPTLCRVSTAPQTSVKSRREQARNISTNKLNRMGFSRNDMAARTPPPPPSNKRFGGLKSLLQPFKAR